jgi:DNA polymerase-3 subunit epsilon
MHGLWDVSPIRRCTTKGRGCGFAQLGIAVCPHDGSISQSDYHLIVTELIDGIEGNADPLFERLRARIATLVDHQRFEDAAQLRDRWESLTRALASRRAWKSLHLARHIEATGNDGVSVAIDHGRLTAAWSDGHQKPLTALYDERADSAHVSMVRAEEASLIWRWLSESAIRLDSVSGTLACPSQKIPTLAVPR